MSIPLFTLPGRELPLSVSMEYDSQGYQYREIPNPPGDPIPYYEFLGWRKKTGVGGFLNAAKKEVAPPSYSYTYPYGWFQDVDLTFTWLEWDGTNHNFTKRITRSCADGQFGWCQQPNPTDAVIYDNHTIDSGASEFLRLTTGTHFSDGSEPAKMFLKDGRDLNFTARSVHTRNGNFLSVSNTATQTATYYGTGLADYLPSSDTTGRSIAWSDNGTVQTITLTDANGQPQTYRITWTTLNLSTFLCQYGTANSTFKVVSSMELPNGRSYTLEYNTSTGYLSKLTLPSGAYIRYTYTVPVGHCRYWVSTRTVSHDGTAASEKTWAYGYDWQIYEPIPGDAWFRWLSSSTVTSPAGPVTDHFFAFPSCNWYSYCIGMESRVAQRQGSTTLKTVDKTWTGGTNPAVSSAVTTFWIYKSERKLYYDSYNNVTQDEQYDWGLGAVGPRLRYITRTYSASNQTYLDNWILTRLGTEKVYTNAGTLIAETNFELDNYASPNQLITRSGTIPGWTDPGSTLRGNTTHIKRWLNTNGSWLTTVQKYDVLGNVATVTDPGGHVTQMDFTDNFTDSINRYTYAYSKRVTDPTGFYADTTYDFNTGLVRQVTDALARTTTMTYDQMNRELQTTNPINGWTRYVYDDVTPKVTKEILVDAQGNLGRVITRFDKLYRVTQTETSDPADNIFVDTQYDSNGRKWKGSNPYRTGDTVLWTQFQYDALDRPTVTTAPDNSTVQYAYNDNQTTVTDEAGNQRRYTYDGVGQMTKVEEPNPTLDTPLVTTYTYNVLGKLTQTVQGAQTRTFNFDSLGRTTSQVLPESGTTSFTYNVDNLLLTKTDARNITTTITYHATQVHKLGTRSYSDGTPSVSFQYDSAGRQTQMTDGLGTVTQTYVTNTDRLQQEQRTLTGATGTFTTAHVYNIKGDLTQMTYPSGRVVNFNYATGGGCCNSRLSSVADQTTNTTINSSLSYNAAGETTAHTLGNGLAQSYIYILTTAVCN